MASGLITVLNQSRSVVGKQPSQVRSYLPLRYFYTATSLRHPWDLPFVAPRVLVPVTLGYKNQAHKTVWEKSSKPALARSNSTRVYIGYAL